MFTEDIFDIVYQEDKLLSRYINDEVSDAQFDYVIYELEKHKAKLEEERK